MLGGPDPLGQVCDLSAERQVVERHLSGGEGGIVLDGVTGRLQQRDCPSGQIELFIFVEAVGETVVTVMSAGDNDEPCALQDRLAFLVPATGDDLVGVRIVGDVYDAVG